MIQPLGNRIALTVKEVEEKSAGGLVLTAATKKSRELTGEVVALSKKVQEGNELALGHQVLFQRDHATKVIVDQQEYYVLDVEDAIAVIG